MYEPYTNGSLSLILSIEETVFKSQHLLNGGKVAVFAIGLKFNVSSNEVYYKSNVSTDAFFLNDILKSNIDRPFSNHNCIGIKEKLISAVPCNGYSDIESLSFICEARPTDTISGNNQGKTCHFPYRNSQNITRSGCSYEGNLK